MSDFQDHVRSAFANRYPIERELGQGGMATVYLARDLKHERDVALKVLRPELAAVIGADRFLTEIRVTANLQHPHILSLHDSGEVDGFLFYVMPYVEGESLRDKLKREAQLAIADGIRIASSVASALDYAHQRQIVHRDIKPENILLQNGHTWLADFGIALTLSAVGAEHLTATGMAVGTPSYMSPEQAGGEGRVDGRSDLYSLASVLYEMLTGEQPYTGATPQAILVKRLTDPIPSARRLRPTVPESLDAAIVKAMNRTPIDRFSTATDFAVALQHAAVEVPSESTWSAAASPDLSSVGIELHTPTRHGAPLHQQIQFCTARDGVGIAYATVGEGPPLVKASNWLSHLEFDWQSPVWRHWWEGLAEHHRLIRYDERGCGLSDWDVEDMSFDAWVSDLEAVVDAAGLDRFALLGVSQGGPIAVTYATKHPERVTHLVLHGSYARGKAKRDLSEEDLERARTELKLVKLGWGQENPAFRQVFSMLFFPDANVEQLRWFNELERISTSPKNAVRIMRTFSGIDVRDVARKVSVPTLVLHSKDEFRVPFTEGRELASLIPGARFVPLPSKNHIPLEREAAWPQFLEAVRGFLSEGA